MRKNYICITFCFLLTFIEIQAQLSITYPFNNKVLAPCPADSSISVNTLQYCSIYQTTNNQWDGPIDSDICLDVYTQNGQHRIPLADADLSRSIFVKCTFPDSAKIALPENIVGEQRLDFTTTATLQLGDTCAQSVCTGAWIGIEIPGGATGGLAMRRYDEPSSLYSVSSGGIRHYRSKACLPTEKFINGNFLKEIVSKFTVLTANSADYISLNSFQYDTYENVDSSGGGGFLFCPLRDREIYNPIGHHYDISLSDYFPIVLEATYLVMYEDSTYPSPQQVSFVEFNPNPPSVIQDTIDATWNGTLVFQPYTGIRGGLVAGDTVRHIVNLINLGSEMCLPGFIEMYFGDKMNYIHRSGSIHLGGEMACIMMQRGSSFIVDEGATLSYGVNGKGMLGWRSGASVILRENAVLYFDGTMVLLENPGEGIQEDVTISLPPGSLLQFTEKSKIFNFCSLGRKIRILMKGGFLDISRLQPEYRQHIEIVYDEKPFLLEDNLRILGNPVWDEIEWQYISDKPENISLEIFDTKAERLFQTTYSTQKGTNVFQTKISTLPIGLYFVRFSTAEGSLYRKIEKVY